MRIKSFQKLITIIVIVTFLWSNFVWAEGLATHLAPSTNLPVLYRDAQVDYIALDVINTLSSGEMGDIKVFYEREIEEKIRKGGRNIRCFGIRDMNRQKSGWAFYVVDLYKGEVTRYLSADDVRDRFFPCAEYDRAC